MGSNFRSFLPLSCDICSFCSFGRFCDEDGDEEDEDEGGDETSHFCYEKCDE